MEREIKLTNGLLGEEITCELVDQINPFTLKKCLEEGFDEKLAYQVAAVYQWLCTLSLDQELENKVLSIMHITK